MSQISSMNDSELHQKVKSLAAEERHLTGLVLEHIAEVDRRKLYKDSSSPVHASVQKEILNQLKHKSNEETDFILAKELNIKIENNDKTRIQRDESMRVEITFSKEEMALIRKAQDLLSHKTGGGLKETLVEMAKKVVKASEPRGQKPRGGKIDYDSSTATVAVARNIYPIGARQVWSPPTAQNFAGVEATLSCMPMSAQK